jgi:DMSO/TMAO reductase YedYZ molybdopterin-dependent catalytic subunit
MSTPHLSRRAVLLQGSAAIAGLALLRVPGLAFAFSAQPGEEVLTWLDQPAPNPVPDVLGTQLHWEALDTWLTPNGQFFTVGHYDKPVLDPAAWRLQIGGVVHQPMTLTLDDLKARPRQEVTFTLECSGNNGLPFLTVPSATPPGQARHWRRCCRKRVCWTRASRSSSSAATWALRRCAR